MHDVMDQLSKPQSPLSTESPVGEPRRSPVKFIVLGMLLLALATGAWAWFHFRDRVSSDDAEVDAHITAAAAKIARNGRQVLVPDHHPRKGGELRVVTDPRAHHARLRMPRAAPVPAPSRV